MATKPKEGQIVFVAGGVAQYRGGVFYTGMEDPRYERPIKWPVEWWLPLSWRPASQQPEPCECPSRKALEPFEAHFHRMFEADDYSYMNERIKDWFGVGDFAAARKARMAPCPLQAEVERLRAELSLHRTRDTRIGVVIASMQGLQAAMDQQYAFAYEPLFKTWSLWVQGNIAAIQIPELKANAPGDVVVDPAAKGGSDAE